MAWELQRIRTNTIYPTACSKKNKKRSRLPWGRFGMKSSAQFCTVQLTLFHFNAHTLVSCVFKISCTPTQMYVRKHSSSRKSSDRSVSLQVFAHRRPVFSALLYPTRRPDSLNDAPFVKDTFCTNGRKRSGAVFMLLCKKENDKKNKGRCSVK